MSRDIKFRAWIENGWDDNDNPRYEMCYDLAFEEYAPVNDLLANVKHLMQYTGLKDKNGKEIYEGDIVDYSNWQYNSNGNPKGVIKYHDGAFVIGEEMELLHTKYPTTEIIGNIYENQNLLV